MRVFFILLLLTISTHVLRAQWKVEFGMNKKTVLQKYEVDSVSYNEFDSNKIYISTHNTIEPYGDINFEFNYDRLVSMGWSGPVLWNTGKKIVAQQSKIKQIVASLISKYRLKSTQRNTYSNKQYLLVTREQENVAVIILTKYQ